MTFITRGFKRRNQEDVPPGRVPPGQYVTGDFPVLTAGPTPRVVTDQWRFSITDTAGESVGWSWDEFRALPADTFTVDIHCVTKWSKLDTTWTGVSLDTLIQEVDSTGSHVMARSYGGYTTNVPVADLTGNRAWVVYEYDGAPLAAEHGGPARLLVPHLYFWKSAKWVENLTLMTGDRPGFWESYGYHIYGDPWKEQRYTGD